MYKIYINDNCLVLCSDKELKSILNKKRKQLATPTPAKSKFLLQYIDMMEKGEQYQDVILHGPYVKNYIRSLKDLFRVVRASGGMVVNEYDEILWIFRRGHWDLPKGKIDLGETKKVAAVREVMEETGIKNIELGSKITRTFHLFRPKSGIRTLKITDWYFMSSPRQHLKPQKSEDIEKAIWKKLDNSNELLKGAYPSIRDVISIANNPKL